MKKITFKLRTLPPAVVRAVSERARQAALDLRRARMDDLGRHRAEVQALHRREGKPS